MLMANLICKKAIAACYQPDCKHVLIEVLLKEKKDRPKFNQIGRFCWESGQARFYSLYEYENCPRCGTLFTLVIKLNKNPLSAEFIGYDADPE
ncbi:MAG: hypothetical protein UT48_C0017G0023 [Parcubacteria group bacterium GW2011_GWE2_39_37]|uniref:Uncharacterized protein n=1 Tax=Candidatus Falkowbacteria bacterium GW2011_GWF2_39_8 TaxID=1618642 RepID=A0A0G0PZ31_9BACT|nr:MAG: hypothetical protein UT48_C0017G0023 [Parcubacteria group bacterium GW2011_GWE2_39_37]KKR33394.1 MAG: hypothetical protein UT64_C0009G0006 [Candidatus Falkowbacteria bacterium GW2011_GWF2_39_8]